MNIEQTFIKSFPSSTLLVEVAHLAQKTAAIFGMKFILTMLNRSKIKDAVEKFLPDPF